jgi:DGQHR domain-containing protein
MSKDEPIIVDFIKINQNERIFYLFKIYANDLLSVANYNPREIDRETGIQRTYKADRSKEIAEYIDSENSVLANSLIVNLNSKYIKINKDKLEISRIEKSVFIIDGQHRLRAFDFASKKEYELPVSGFVDLSVSEIAEIFVKINYYQKPVNKSLVYDLLGISPELFPEYFEAHKITKILNDNTESPWFGLIKMLGIGKGIITQATFITAIEENNILKDTLNDYTTNERIKILSNYFSAIKLLFQKQWGHKGSIISKSVGYYAFIKIFPDVFNNVVNRTKGFKVNDIVEYLKPITEIDFESDDISSLGGKKGVATLAEKMKMKYNK